MVFVRVGIYFSKKLRGPWNFPQKYEMVKPFFSVYICTIMKGDKEQEMWEEKNNEAYLKGNSIAYSIIVLRWM